MEAKDQTLKPKSKCIEWCHVHHSDCLLHLANSLARQSSSAHVVAVLDVGLLEISVNDCWLASIAVSELHCHDEVDMCFWVYDVTRRFETGSGTIEPVSWNRFLRQITIYRLDYSPDEISPDD